MLGVSFGGFLLLSAQMMMHDQGKRKKAGITEWIKWPLSFSPGGAREVIMSVFFYGICSQYDEPVCFTLFLADSFV